VEAHSASSYQIIARSGISGKLYPWVLNIRATRIEAYNRAYRIARCLWDSCRRSRVYGIVQTPHHYHPVRDNNPSPNQPVSQSSDRSSLSLVPIRKCRNLRAHMDRSVLFGFQLLDLALAEVLRICSNVNGVLWLTPLEMDERTSHGSKVGYRPCRTG